MLDYNNIVVHNSCTIKIQKESQPTDEHVEMIPDDEGFEQLDGQFFVLFETMSQGAVYYQSDGTILTANRAAQKLLGLSLDQLRGKTPQELKQKIIHEDGSDFLAEGYPSRITLSTEQCVKQEVMGIFLPSEGRYRWLSIDAIPQYLPGQIQPYLILVIVDDITERRDAQETLLLEEQRFHMIWESASDAMSLSDPDGTVLAANAAYYQLYGFKPEEVIGHNFSIIFPVEVRGLAREAYKVVFASEKVATPLEAFVIRADGMRRIVETTYDFIVHNGKRTALISIIRDITERKQAEEARAQLAAVVESSQDAIIGKDIEGIITSWNKGAELMYGYTAGEVVGQSITLFFPKGSKDEFDSLMAMTKRGERIDQFETVRRRKDGSLFQVSISISPIKNANGDAVGGSVIARDITEQKRQTQLLEKRKDEFIMSVNHELRTPLTAISGYLELLQEYDQSIDAATKEAMLSHAIENCNELMHLVNSLLNALHFRSEIQPAHQELFFLAPLINEVLGQLDMHKRATYLFQVKVPEQITVWADKQFVQQILHHLLSNIFKYVPAYTSILITAALWENGESDKEDDPQVCISVKDSGPGIPLLEKHLLFQKFARLQRDLYGTVRGTGLGLYICKQLVGAMSGKMWVESSGQFGEGSRFCFTLPESASHFELMNMDKIS